MWHRPVQLRRRWQREIRARRADRLRTSRRPGRNSGASTKNSRYLSHNTKSTMRRNWNARIWRFRSRACVVLNGRRVEPEIAPSTATTWQLLVLAGTEKCLPLRGRSCGRDRSCIPAVAGTFPIVFTGRMHREPEQIVKSCHAENKTWLWVSSPGAGQFPRLQSTIFAAGVWLWLPLGWWAGKRLQDTSDRRGEERRNHLFALPRRKSAPIERQARPGQP